MLKKMHAIAAFTFLEMSVVLAIISLVVAGGLIAFTVSVQTRQYNATIATMQMIDDALLKFRIANNRLPCPGYLYAASTSQYYGLEAWSSTTSSCDSSTTHVTVANNSYASGATKSGMSFTEGSVPYIPLGLPPGAMYDGWGDKIRYAVTNQMTVVNAFSTYPVNASCSGIEVCDQNGATTSAPYYCYYYPRTTSAAYVLVSHGANGHGAYKQNATAMTNAGSTNANELVNCHCTSNAASNGYTPTYVQALPSVATSGSLATAFDDIVTYKERWQLRAPANDLPANLLYVPDSGSGQCGIQVYNGNGTFLCKINPAGSSNHEWWDWNGNSVVTTPSVVKVDASGHVWFINNGTITEEAANGEYIPPYSSMTSLPAQGTAPTGTTTTQAGASDIAFDSAGNVWIANTSASTIYGYAANLNTALTTANCSSHYPSGVNQVYNCTAAPIVLSTISGAPTAPASIAIDSNNNMWVVDTASSNQRIDELKYDGTLLSSITSWGTACGTTSHSFSVIGQVSVDSSNNLWVSDITNNAIVKFNSSGVCSAYLTFTTSACDGCFAATTAPYGLNVDSNGLLWVSDPARHRVQQIDFCTGCSSPTGAQIWIQTLGGGGPTATCQTCPTGTGQSCSCGTSTNTNQYFTNPAFLGVSAR